MIKQKFLCENKVSVVENNSLLELDDENRQEIGKIWLDTFRKGKYAKLINDGAKHE